jgi:MoaA/NifB/PqqE/SkfB family radical SAM enzyme
MMSAPKGIHVEPTNICTLKCPGCARTRFIQQWPQHWKNHSIEIAALTRFLDIDLAELKITLCGNYGDPIYHPQFPDLVDALKTRRAKISIITNGSYKTAEWWQQLAQSLDDDDEITFSIDGLPDNFTEYRINADWPSIRTGIEVCAHHGVRSLWKFIPFAYNQEQIEIAAKLSRDLGMSGFYVDPSARFDDRTLEFQPSTDLISSTKDLQDRFKKGHSLEIDPKCAQGSEHFISAEGFYSPCCYVADHRFYYKSQFGKNKKEYDIRKSTLTDLLQAKKTVEFYDSITVDKPRWCQYSCPKMNAVDR